MTCAHHWRIESPDGRRLLPGTCKTCGATREFRASDEELGRQQELTLIGSQKHARPPKPRKDPATHCVKGHPLTDENLTHEGNGRRRCKTCRQVYSRKSKRKVTPAVRTA